MIKQKIWGVVLIVAGTICSIATSNWFCACITYPLGWLSLTSKENILMGGGQYAQNK